MTDSTFADRKEQLLEKANGLPFTPGVYLMKDKRGKIIYVGKSKVLRQRVSQYFQQNRDHTVKTRHMVDAVWDFQYMLCDTEMEALTLENKLIKLHKPRYNIRLKDSKSYPYLKLSVGDAYPSLTVTRSRSGDKAKYFGPYSGIGTAYAILNTIRQAFALPNCKREFPRDIGKDRPCLYYQMGQCCGVCTGKVSSEEYRTMLSDITEFLNGNFRKLRESLEGKMAYASDNLMFEAAAIYRDRIRALEKILQKQKVVGSPDTEQDIISVYYGELSGCITVFYVREGCVVDSESFPFPADTIMDGGAFVSFVADLYSHREYLPHEILLGADLSADELSELEAYLQSLSRKKVSLRISQRGEGKHLCDMVTENARQMAEQYQRDAEKDNNLLIRLAQVLALEVVPERIEAYDISNFGSDNITAGMVVAENGKMKKSEYRVFHIRDMAQPDDYASMRQAIERRMAHPEFPYPDLILLDGGRGHVSTVRAWMTEHGFDIPVFGMVKDQYHKTRALSSDEGDISIARDHALFTFIYKLQEEVHRFTVSRMSQAKSQTLRHSVLEEIPGIGQSKAAALLRQFGTLKAIKSADLEEIGKTPGLSRRDAMTVYQFYRKETPK